MSWMYAFTEFMDHLKIESKELEGPQPLLSNIYDSQRLFLRNVAEGLDQDIHYFVCLKARQLGISTISLAITLFWIIIHDGIQGALITKDEADRDKFRIILDRYMRSLPKRLRIAVVKHNRNNLVLANGSVLDYVVAGQKKVGGGLGRSRAWNLVHGTECSSWGSVEGVASMKACLAQKHPNRLFMFESTARGFNLFNDMWIEAEEDELTQRAFFIGWWAKEDYRFDRDSEKFNHFWDGKLNDGEKILVKQVKKTYDYEIIPEQIAWHRWARTHLISDEALMDQEYPWTAEMAFIMTGQAFFPRQRVSDDIKFIGREKPLFKGYRYHMGENFLATTVEQVTKAADADLRIYEEPHPNGVYVIGADPAFGRSDVNDQHALQVLRCYADRAVQVAEYGTSFPDTYQFAWVLAHVAGSYRNVWVNLEINGPGPVVMQELKHLRQLIQSGYLEKSAMEKGMQEVFDRVRWYLYHRVDSIGGNFMYNWKTTQDNKLAIMNQYRDNYALRYLSIRSMRLLEQMQKIVQDGGEICADNRGKDDLVFAMALANRAWIDWVRAPMISAGDTIEKVTDSERLAAEKPGATMVSYMVEDFWRQKEQARMDQKYADAWRGKWA